MDIVFKCPSCQTDLEVDSLHAGQTIACPACEKPITIPEPTAANVKPNAPAPPPPPPTAAGSVQRLDKKLAVNVTDRPSEPLIQKANKPLDVAAKEGRPGLRLKTIRHSDCKEVGHDHFDATVTEFLNKIGDEALVSITPINYSFLELGTQKLLTDFGVIIIYRG